VFAVRVVDLHGYTPHLKGTVETLNGAVKSMFFAGARPEDHRGLPDRPMRGTVVLGLTVPAVAQRGGVA